MDDYISSGEDSELERQLQAELEEKRSNIVFRTRAERNGTQAQEAHQQRFKAMQWALPHETAEKAVQLRLQCIQHPAWSVARDEDFHTVLLAQLDRLHEEDLALHSARRHRYKLEGGSPFERLPVELQHRIFDELIPRPTSWSCEPVEGRGPDDFNYTITVPLKELMLAGRTFYDNVLRRRFELYDVYAGPAMPKELWDSIVPHVRRLRWDFHQDHSLLAQATYVELLVIVFDMFGSWSEDYQVASSILVTLWLFIASRTHLDEARFVLPDAHRFHFQASKPFFRNQWPEDIMTHCKLKRLVLHGIVMRGDDDRCDWDALTALSTLEELTVHKCRGMITGHRGEEASTGRRFVNLQQIALSGCDAGSELLGSLFWLAQGSLKKVDLRMDWYHREEPLQRHALPYLHLCKLEELVISAYHGYALESILAGHLDQSLSRIDLAMDFAPRSMYGTQDLGRDTVPWKAIWRRLSGFDLKWLRMPAPSTFEERYRRKEAMTRSWRRGRDRILPLLESRGVEVQLHRVDECESRMVPVERPPGPSANDDPHDDRTAARWPEFRARAHEATMLAVEHRRQMQHAMDA